MNTKKIKNKIIYAFLLSFLLFAGICFLYHSCEILGNKPLSWDEILDFDFLIVFIPISILMSFICFFHKNL